MGYLTMSLSSKAAHLVSDILNPLNDDEHSRPPVSEEDSEDNNSETEQDDNLTSPNGPDTSSFKAFLISLLSPDSQAEHMDRNLNFPNPEPENPESTSETKENKGKKSLISRGKQSVGKLLTKAAKIGGFKHESKLDSHTVSHTDVATPPDQEPELRPVKVELKEEITPLMSEQSVLMSADMRTALYSSLPVLVQGRHWVLLYSTWRHGISLSTLYRRSALCPGYSLLIVGDKKGAVFGGLVEAPLQPTNKKKYQGTNNSFVFTDLQSYPAIYPPTGSNHYFTLCATDSLALGGGGHFALYLDGDLLNGSSSRSDTFNNPCLASSEDFEVKEVELWGFVYASKYEEMIELCRSEKPGICRW